MVRIPELSKLFRRISVEIQSKREELCELDGHVGDGDHGISMDIGWTAVCEVSTENVADCGEYLIACARAFMQAVGASIGPLYGTGFLRAASVAKGKSELSPSDCIKMFNAGVLGMQERGKAKVGDKTLLDTLLPCVDALTDGVEERAPLSDVLQNSLFAAKKGMESTENMVANIGRSSRLGDRSRGTLDPGAASAYFMVQALYDFISENVNSDTQVKA